MANQLLSFSNKIFSIVYAMLKAFVYVAKKRDKLFAVLISKTLHRHSSLDVTFLIKSENYFI